jgi:hypothetical protein
VVQPASGPGVLSQASADQEPTPPTRRPCLPEQAVPPQITRELQREDLDAAIELLDCLPIQPGKGDECKRVISWCLAHPTIDAGLYKAARVAQACLKGDEQRAALVAVVLLRKKLQQEE